MPRFVILEHDYPELHWDFMLECGEVLRTWRLAALPQEGQPVSARASFDHRPLYLDYEGPVSGNRGRVKRWDGGTFQWVIPESGEPEKEILVLLKGDRVQGRTLLSRLGEDEWLFTLSLEGG
jgi:hypothetical protein